MQFLRLGLALTLFTFLTPAFAIQCPSAEKVRSCSGDNCTFKQFPGWSESIYYTDHGKSFALQKTRTEKTAEGSRISCFYAYIDPAHGKMPTALVLSTVVK